MKTSVQILFFCWLFVTFPFLSRAQDSFFERNALGVQGHYGSFITMAPKARYIKDSYSAFGEIYFENSGRLNQTKKPKPLWGSGLIYGQTGSRQYLGRMAAAFAFTHLPFIQKKYFYSGLRIGAGIGWIEKPYDKNVNFKNTLIGTHLNGYFNFLFLNEIRVRPDVFLNAGFSFTHLSNGGSTLPNLGLNVPAFTAGVRYGGSRQRMSKTRTDSLNKKISVSLYTTAGWKQAPWIDSKRYFINTLGVEVSRRFAYASQYGGGVISFYNPSLEYDPSQITSVKRDISKYQAAVYGSYEHFVGRFSVPLQIGYFIFNPDDFSPVFQQVGVRYHLSHHLVSEVLLKTHGGKADLLHAGIGYKF